MNAWKSDFEYIKDQVDGMKICDLFVKAINYLVVQFIIVNLAILNFFPFGSIGIHDVSHGLLPHKLTILDAKFP